MNSLPLLPTKEALLLELLEDRLGRWLGELESRLESGTVPADPDGAARLISSTLLADEDLVRLLMILGAILEQNVPERRIRGVQDVAPRPARGGGLSPGAGLPFLARWGGVKLLLELQALVSGLGQFTHPAPAVARVLAAPEFEALRSTSRRSSGMRCRR